MVIAGIVTTPGGNLLGPIMAGSGFVLILLGSQERPLRVDRSMVVLTLVGSVLLVGGWWLALSLGQ